MVAFKCLGNKSVIQAQVSDHEPIIDGAVCVFNLMCRGSGSNNYFKKSESTTEYVQRLDQLINVIRELKNSGVDVFIFQEAPQYNSADDRSNSFYNKLKQIPGFESLNINNITNTTGTRSALFTIADYNRYPKQINTTAKSNIPIPGRVQSVQITSLDYQTMTVVNIHGDYMKQSDTRNALRQCVSRDSAAVIGGDFNISTGAADFNEFQGAGIYQKADLFGTCDGLLASSNGRVQDFVPVINKQQDSIGITVNSHEAKTLLDNFKYSPYFRALHIGLNQSGYIPNIQLTSPPELLANRKSLITFTGTHAVALSNAFNSYCHNQVNKESTHKTHHTSTDTDVSKVESARALFFKSHREAFKKSQSGCFGFFRRTEVRSNMTLTEIIEHAQKHDNRSRKVCVALGWMDKNGALNEVARELIQIDTPRLSNQLF
ncbi:hypothetical protein [Legionella quateirensis]|uniref:Endonuclease/Exonuclease/phosphatase family n=1 Tax=Legionella quateirensis TaxID=45072 RepID=A0A378KTY6_9GAMM|nr:hypothetical protein [Legionella quateirensis]KTD51117.1 hypothetical protein Lqua_1344 [Legionella quateirensis]STY17639.1 Uncharacterised protein [Legionella quateirensis]